MRFATGPPYTYFRLTLGIPQTCLSMNSYRFHFSMIKTYQCGKQSRLSNTSRSRNKDGSPDPRHRTPPPGVWGHSTALTSRGCGWGRCHQLLNPLGGRGGPGRGGHPRAEPRRVERCGEHARRGSGTGPREESAGAAPCGGPCPPGRGEALSAPEPVDVEVGPGFVCPACRARRCTPTSHPAVSCWGRRTQMCSLSPR